MSDKPKEKKIPLVDPDFLHGLTRDYYVASMDHPSDEARIKEDMPKFERNAMFVYPQVRLLLNLLVARGYKFEPTPEDKKRFNSEDALEGAKLRLTIDELVQAIREEDNARRATNGYGPLSFKSDKKDTPKNEKPMDKASTAPTRVRERTRDR